ncbi:MAG: c-type cytochrome [Gaiellaceae bacterium]
MRRTGAVIASLLLAAAVLAGCGAQGVVSPTPETQIGKGPAVKKFPIVPAFHVKGNSAAGKAVFLSAGCTSCHTLAAAHSTGTVGPNLDALKPNDQAVTAQVTNGGPGMPAFGKTKQLSTTQVANVAAFVVDSTGGTAP